MKVLLNVLLASTFLFAGCAKDNVEPPKSTLSGRIIYQDQVVGVRNNSSTDLGNASTMLELWQHGYQLFTKIPVTVNQDGTYSAVLFDGNYKLVRTRGSGPWVDNTESIDVQVHGSTTIDVPVQPYFIVKNEKFQKNGSTLNATALVSQVVPGRKIDRVVLFVSTTQFVDANNGVALTDAEKAKNTGNVLTGSALTDLSKEVSLSFVLPSALRGVCYARIGVKADGVGEYLYTPVQKIEF